MFTPVPNVYPLPGRVGISPAGFGILPKQSCSLLRSRRKFGMAGCHTRLGETPTLPARLVTPFESQLGDAGLVEVAQAFCDHTVVLFFRRAGERQLEAGVFRQEIGRASCRERV